MTAPLVSILMVARNAAPFIDAAILSARRQSVADIEIIVVDDESHDDTAAIAGRHADGDGRMRLLQGPGRGLSAVRNASLSAARGRFAAILDSDDILDPRHVEWLLACQAQHGAEICATNMIEFQEDGPAFTAHVFAQGRPWSQVRPIGPDEFVKRGMIGAPGVSLGYLKPLLDLNFLRSKGISYDERLRIGEDFDLVLRTMLAGGRFLFIPQTSYYYRKHAASTSHRLEHADLEGLLKAAQGYDVAMTSAVAGHLDARCDNLRGALRHLDTIAALKAGRFLQALRLLSRNREARRMTFASLREAMVKRIGGRAPARLGPKPVFLAQGETLPERLREMSQALPVAVPRP